MYTEQTGAWDGNFCAVSTGKNGREPRYFLAIAASSHRGTVPAVLRTVTAMSISVRHEDGNMFRLDIRGTLRSQDFRNSQEAIAAEITRVGRVRLLILLEGFEGWEPRDDWRDLSFFVSRGDEIDRIAIVGDERWRSEALMFAGSDLRKAPVEFFSNGALAAARDWLNQ